MNVDPDHAVALGRAFPLLVDAKTGTGAPSCRVWYMVTTTAPQDIMQHFRHREVDQEYAKKRCGKGGCGARGRWGRGLVAARGVCVRMRRQTGREALNQNS